MHRVLLPLADTMHWCPFDRSIYAQRIASVLDREVCHDPTGIQIIPTMPVAEVIEIAVAAEELGYDFCLLADEGFMPDVYVTLGAIAQRTKRIKIGPVTNGYTRHPAVTANAIATLDDLSGGRALAMLVAGGSMVLTPMGIPRDAPLTVMRETIAILRQLWRGEEVTWVGQALQSQPGPLARWPAPRYPPLAGGTRREDARTGRARSRRRSPYGQVRRRAGADDCGAGGSWAQHTV